MQMYETLKITAYPRTGIEADAYLPIDGILYYHAMQREYGPQLITTPGQVANVASVPLPLARAGAGEAWFYAASFAEWGPHSDYGAFWVKRFDRQHADVVDFGGRRGNVIVEKGRYKSYHQQTFLRHALWVSWYVVGERAEIEALLARVTHIGKKTAQGNGRINEWRVEPWAEDWSVWRGERLMRAIPDAGGILYGIRPPYWLPENQVQCRLPEQR